MDSLMPFGYWKIDPKSGVARPKINGVTVPAIAPDDITDFDSDYLLVGVDQTKCLSLEWNLMGSVGGGGTTV